MALLDKVKGVVYTDETKPPKDVVKRIERGRRRMLERRPINQMCMEFFEGNQYVEVSEKKVLIGQNRLYVEKDRWRIRQVRNLLVGVVQTEVSAANQRIPSYDVTPSTADPEDVAAARLSQRVALYGYDAWNIREIAAQTITHAVVTDYGFAQPYFSDGLGRPLVDRDGPVTRENGQPVHEGEVRIRTLGADQVYWEPGVRFHDSRWYCIERAEMPDAVLQYPNFIGEQITPDAGTTDTNTSEKADLVLVKEYVERPCPKYPNGRRLLIANNRQICPTEDYPFKDAKGKVIDEPCLHPLSYITQPNSDRDSGLIYHGIDPQRTFNDCINKQLEWKNAALAPQAFLVNGQIDEVITDEPGKIYQVKSMMGQTDIIKWKPVPPVPPELSAMAETARRDIQDISSQNDIPNQIDSGKGVQTFIERDQTRRQAFIANVAEWHSRLMRHCLILVQSHYTTERMVKLRGRLGWESIPDFVGAQLRGQVDVTVLPGSVEPRTKQAIEQRVMNFAQLGWISPEVAMAAINGGTAENLIDDYELDVARQNLEIRKVINKDLTDAREFDNHKIHLHVLETYMKTPDFDGLDPVIQEALLTHRKQHQQLDAEQEARAQAAQSAQAEQMGMDNAAKPQAPKPNPSLPSLPS